MNTRFGAIAAALLGSAGLAHAAKVEATDFQAGLTSQTITVGGVDVTLLAQNHGVAFEGNGLGVSGGGGSSEVGSNDRLTFTFSEAVNVRRLEVEKLFAIGYKNDAHHEGVKITTDNGTFHFHASDVPMGTVAKHQSFGGHLMSMSEPDTLGAWRTYGDMLFGGPITFMRLEADPAGIWPYYADFTFSSMNFVRVNPVPAPGAAALLGLGGLVAARRRR